MMSETETFLTHNTASVQDSIHTAHLASQVNWQVENAQKQQPVEKSMDVSCSRTGNIIVTIMCFISGERLLHLFSNFHQYRQEERIE